MLKLPMTLWICSHDHLTSDKKLVAKTDPAKCLFITDVNRCLLNHASSKPCDAREATLAWRNDG